MNFRNISAWSIRNPVVPIVFFIGLVIAGVVSFMRMDIQQMPDIEFPMVIINVSQPGALARGQTVVTPESDVSVQEDASKMFLLDTGVSLNDLVAAVNRVGAAPGDLVAILEALQRVGALRAQLIVI